MPLDTAGPLRHQETATQGRPASELRPAHLGLLLAGIFLISWILRLPHLQTVPAYTDEVRQVKYAVRLIWGEMVPLSLTGYNGPLMTVLISLGLAVLPGPDTPRLVASLVGAALPTLTALVGLRRGGVLPALLAAGLVSSSFTMVVIYGHLPWNISLALLFLLATWWLSLAPLERLRPYRSGFCYGLALLCHPLVIGFAPWILWRHARVIRRSPGRWALYLGSLALAVSPLALHHGLAWSRGEAAGLGSSAPALLEDMGRVPYPEALKALLRSLVDALSGAGHAEHFPVVADGMALLAVGLALLGLAGACVARDGMLLSSAAGFLLFTPILVREYGFPMGTRYSALLVPLVWLSVVAVLWGENGRLRPRRILVTLILGAFMLASSRRVAAFQWNELAQGRDNRAIIALIDGALTGCDAVVLDNRIEASFSAGGTYSRVIEARLNLQGIRPDRQDDAAGIAAAIRRRPGGCAFVSDAHRAELSLLHGLPDLRERARLSASERGEGVALLAWDGF